MKYSKCWWAMQGTEDLLRRRCMFVCRNPQVQRVVTAEYCQTCELRILEHPTEKCWRTGNYTDDCDCEFCNHKHECSGYEGGE